MSSKKEFNVNDKVFAKIRGYPAWPAIISGVKADTPSRQRYNVYFYGTGEHAECKPETLFPYEENKSKLGKPNKRKYFAEALLQIEDDDDGPVRSEEYSKVPVTPSNTSNIEQKSPKDESKNDNEVEKSTIDESTSRSTLSKEKKVVASRKSLGFSIAKGTKRKISDVKPEARPKKSMKSLTKILKSLNTLNLKRHLAVGIEPLEKDVIERARTQLNSCSIRMTKHPIEVCPRSMVEYECSSEEFSIVWMCRNCTTFLLSRTAAQNHVSRCDG